MHWAWICHFWHELGVVQQNPHHPCSKLQFSPCFFVEVHHVLQFLFCKSGIFCSVWHSTMFTKYFHVLPTRHLVLIFVHSSCRKDDWDKQSWLVFKVTWDEEAGTAILLLTLIDCTSSTDFRPTSFLQTTRKSEPPCCHDPVNVVLHTGATSQIFWLVQQPMCFILWLTGWSCG